MTQPLSILTVCLSHKYSYINVDRSTKNLIRRLVERLNYLVESLLFVLPSPGLLLLVYVVLQSHKLC